MTNANCPFCNLTHKTVVPTVHTNGTSAHELRDQLQAAIEALRTAQQKLEQAAPNGRDYYPQGGTAQVSALQSHDHRWMQLSRMLTELEEQRDHVQSVLDFMEQNRAVRA